MPFTTWIRDALGIRKDVIDTKKSKLEIDRLEDEKRARNLITPATMNDIKEYDPKFKAIQKKLLDPLDKISLNVFKLLVLLLFLIEISRDMIRGLLELLK